MSVCVRSLAPLAGLFSTIGVLLLLADGYCTEAGGRTSDTAWTCTLHGGEVVSLWALVNLPVVLMTALLVGGPVFLLVRRCGRRWDRCSVRRPDGQP